MNAATWGPFHVRALYGPLDFAAAAKPTPLEHLSRATGDTEAIRFGRETLNELSLTEFFQLNCGLWVCTPRPKRRISLVYMYLLNCRGGRRRRLDLDNAKSFVGRKAATYQLPYDRRESLRIRWAVGFDPHRPYQTNLFSMACNCVF